MLFLTTVCVLGGGKGKVKIRYLLKRPFWDPKAWNSQKTQREEGDAIERYLLGSTFTTQERKVYDSARRWNLHSGLALEAMIIREYAAS